MQSLVELYSVEIKIRAYQMQNSISDALFEPLREFELILVCDFNFEHFKSEYRIMFLRI